MHKLGKWSIGVTTCTVLLIVGCADYNVPEDAFQVDVGRRDASGHVTLRIACIADNSTSWVVTCHRGRWTTDLEVPVNCAQALHDLASSVRVTGATATNQGPYFHRLWT